MKGFPTLIVWYTFLAVLGYLVLTRWTGANALLKTGGGVYIGAVRALQGR